MSRFTPVHDPERARCEQDEESLRKHRQFDTPFALLRKDLNDSSKPQKDSNALARPSGELELDEQKLWRKKNEIFDKKKTWGRETFEYSNPEQAKVEGNIGPKWGRPGTVGWGVQGNFGGKGEDRGLQVLQRGEVDQTMVKNEKGLWVRKKEDASGGSEELVPENNWRCTTCGELASKRECACPECGAPRPEVKARHSSTDAGALKPANPNEDPRLEAAKLKGRGTANAAKEALKALEERRKQELRAKESVGMMRRPPLAGTGGHDGRITTLNNSSQQVKPAQRHKKYHNWQGVQHSVEEAKKIVGKAAGFNQIGNPPPASGSSEKVAEPAERRPRSASPKSRQDDVAWRASTSPSCSCSRSRSPRARKRSSPLAASSARARIRSPSPPAAAADNDSVVVDFF
mmetsp:Transcript_58860/g.164405  ORF Transcript_58860/g.164405 Transcript_58860/m.164405 type:complete len:403 (+) Transcript_58860:88-1296(+)